MYLTQILALLHLMTLNMHVFLAGQFCRLHLCCPGFCFCQLKTSRVFWEKISQLRKYPPPTNTHEN